MASIEVVPFIWLLCPSSQGTKEPKRCARRSSSPHLRVHFHPVVEASRERPETVLGRVVSAYRSVEVVGVALGPRLVGLLRAETCARCEDGVEQARREALVDDQRLGRSPGDQVPCRVLGGVQDYVRYGLRLVDRGDANRFHAELGASLVK